MPAQRQLVSFEQKDLAVSYPEPESAANAPGSPQEPAIPESEPVEIDQTQLGDDPIGDGENAIGATPPGFEWPTHGGYLGCLIGCLASFLIGGFLGSALLGTLYVVGGGRALALAVVSVVVYAALVYGLCRLGWSLGKRYYRSYQDGGATTWGEHDEFIHEATDAEAAPDEADEANTDARDVQAPPVGQDEVQSGGGMRA